MSGDPAFGTPSDPPEPPGGDNRHQSLRLTRNEQLVLNVLRAQSGPMKAYELLERLKSEGIKAPMTVYRALDRLEAKGLIHKLDAMNAFLVCNHDTPHSVQTFVVCSTCNQVKEIEERGFSGLDWSTLKDVATQNAFTAQSARIEIRGICTDCA